MVCKSTEDFENKMFNEFENNMYDTEYLSQQAIMPSRNDLTNETKHQIY